MIRYGLRTVPAVAMAVAVVTAAGLLWMVARWPGPGWPAAGVAVALLGATAARLFDEPAASIVDTLPRPLWWRTVARLPFAVLLAIGWLVGVAVVEVDPGGRPAVIRLEGVAAIVFAAAVATAARRRGSAAPGAAVGAALLLTLLTVALANPAPDLLPLFPFGPDDPWSRSAGLWSAIAVTGSIVLVASCVERGPVRRAGR
jgi:hypothetical protein